MVFRGLTLDRFQVEAIQFLDQGQSVVVSAATGTGKTVIADYIIDKSFKEGKKVFYTAPIKALSNQKYADFKAFYGEEHVGILTGDVVQNPDAPLLIMTTEIYRNMLLAKDLVIDDLAAVVFDEIHYLGDADRGTVWEEAIIFSKPHTRFVCLSATIPNARQFAHWIESIKGHPVAVVTEKERAVPLEHLFFDVYFGISTLADIAKRKQEEAYPHYDDAFGRGSGGGKRGFHGFSGHRQGNRGGGAGRGGGGFGGGMGRRGQARFGGFGGHHSRPSHARGTANPNARPGGQHGAQRGGNHPGKGGRERMNHVDLVKSLQARDMLSCIYFCFSRANTESKARELGDRMHFTSEEQRVKIRAFVEGKLAATDPSVRHLDTTRTLARCLEQGVAFHHAGLLPILKETVEQAFTNGWITVLYATETFAVGINLPARTVCFDSLEKYDGTSFRYLNTKEYFQLAGRAGRRGMDTVGYAVSVVDPEFADTGRIGELVKGDKEPLISQYHLSYNTILNLIANHTEEERRTILLSSFATYQSAGQHREKVIATFENKLQKLQKLDYLHGDALDTRGEFARRIYSHEITITELCTSTLRDTFTELEIILLAAGLEYEEKRQVTFAKRPAPVTRELLSKLKVSRSLHTRFTESDIDKLEPMLASWYAGGSFGELTTLTTMPEGDIVRFMRRIIDVLTQIMHATIQTMPDAYDFKDKVGRAIDALDRGIIKVMI
jgi:antiviral helicase SKI2